MAGVIGPSPAGPAQHGALGGTDQVAHRLQRLCGYADSMTGSIAGWSSLLGGGLGPQAERPLPGTRDLEFPWEIHPSGEARASPITSANHICMGPIVADGGARSRGPIRRCPPAGLKRNGPLGARGRLPATFLSHRSGPMTAGRALGPSTARVPANSLDAPSTIRGLRVEVTGRRAPSSRLASLSRP